MGANDSNKIIMVGLDCEVVTTFSMLLEQAIRVGTLDFKVVAIALVQGALLQSRKRENYHKTAACTVAASEQKSPR